MKRALIPLLLTCLAAAPAAADAEGERRRALMAKHRASLVRVEARVRIEVARLPGIGQGARRSHEVSLPGVVVGKEGLIVFPAAGLDPARAAYELLGAAGPAEVLSLRVVGGDERIREASWLGRDTGTGLAFARVSEAGRAGLSPVSGWPQTASVELGQPLTLLYLASELYGYGPSVEVARVASAGSDRAALSPRLPHALGALALDAAGKPLGLLLPGLLRGKQDLLRVDRLAEAAAGQLVLAQGFTAALAKPPEEVRLRTPTQSARAWLGAQTQVLTPERARAAGADIDVGVLVGEVYEGGARAAGIAKGDVILSLDGEPLDLDPGEVLDDLISDYTVGEEVSLLVRRAGKNRTLRVRLGRSPVRPAYAERLRIAEVGLTLRALTFFDRRRDELPETTTGAVVADLDPDGAASRAGVRVGDLILAVGDEQARSLADLRRLILREGPQPLKVRRSGKDLTLRVRR